MLVTDFWDGRGGAKRPDICFRLKTPQYRGKRPGASFYTCKVTAPRGVFTRIYHGTYLVEPFTLIIRHSRSKAFLFFDVVGVNVPTCQPRNLKLQRWGVTCGSPKDEQRSRCTADVCPAINLPGCLVVVTASSQRGLPDIAGGRAPALVYRSPHFCQSVSNFFRPLHPYRNLPSLANLSIFAAKTWKCDSTTATTPNQSSITVGDEIRSKSGPVLTNSSFFVESIFFFFAELNWTRFGGKEERGEERFRYLGGHIEGHSLRINSILHLV